MKRTLLCCQECLEACRACTVPCLYCKFRQSCVIWELCRKEARKRCKENEGEAGTEEKAKRVRSNWRRRRLVWEAPYAKSSQTAGSARPTLLLV